MALKSFRVQITDKTNFQLMNVSLVDIFTPVGPNCQVEKILMSFPNKPQEIGWEDHFFI